METEPEDVNCDLELTFESMDGSSDRTVAIGSEKRQSNHEETRKASSSTVEARFLQVENASDGLLIGLTQCSRWGLELIDDGDDIWVRLNQLGVILLAEKKESQQGS